MRLSNKIVLATLNHEKFEEFNELFKIYPEIELVLAGDILRNPAGLAFAERHETYLENAVAKARLCNQGAHYPALADDSGLEVDVLGGKPGVRSHRYATPRAGVTQDQANIELLLKEVKSKSAPAPIAARFTATLALVIEGLMLSATGTLEGTIIETPRGKNGFGYDPIFLPKGGNRTLAEMSAKEKNEISHRAHALKELMNRVKEHGLVFAKP